MMNIEWQPVLTVLDLVGLLLHSRGSGVIGKIEIAEFECCILQFRRLSALGIS